MKFFASTILALSSLVIFNEDVFVLAGKKPAVSKPSKPAKPAKQGKSFSGTAKPTAAPATSSPTEAPVTDGPTAAPVTAAPTAAPVTTAPTAALVTSSPTTAPVTKAPTAAPVPSCKASGEFCNIDSEVSKSINMSYQVFYRFPIFLTSIFFDDILSLYLSAALETA